MTYRNDSEKVLGLNGENCALRFAYGNGIRMTHLSAPGANSSLLGSANPFVIVLSVEGEKLDASKMHIEAVEVEETRTSQLASMVFRQQHNGHTIRGRIALRERDGDPMELTVQIMVDWASGVPELLRVALPFLGVLSKIPNFYRPGEGPGEDGAELLSTWNMQEFPPAIISDGPREGAVGFELPGRFPFQDNHNRALDQMLRIGNLEEDEVQITPAGDFTEIFDFRIHGSTKGRAGVFASWKQNVRKKYDLRRYELPGTLWCQKTYLHHFTFAFGKEIYDYDRNSLDIDRLFSEGEQFGGYDAIIFWHQYPRLGLDRRTQWELYDELPNGISGLKQMVDECHRRGVRFFLPFKPWDVQSYESLDDQAKEIERLIEATGVDGFFLDTMQTIPESFSRLVKERFPDLMFSSEGTPSEPPHIEQLTGSWNQFNPQLSPIGAEDIQVNLFRFVFPEHPLNMINRWSVGSQRDILIKRAVFNGTGLVIWQDIFGRWHPYSESQKAKVARLKAALSRYHDDIFGQESFPLVDTMVPGLAANRFARRPYERQVFSIYNKTKTQITGSLLHVQDYSFTECCLLFGEGVEVRATAEIDGTIIEGTINAGDVIMICVENPGNAHTVQ